MFRTCLCLSLVTLLSVSSCLAENLFRNGTPELPRQTAVLPDFSVLAEGLSASVVNISVQGDSGEESEELKSIPGLPFQFRQFLPQRSVGSGVIVSKKGHIITNNHVIKDAEKIIVRVLDDSNEYEAELLGADPKTDIALIKIDYKVGTLQPAYFGNSDSVRVGEWVMAIGNQFQLGQTVTSGIVSAKSRRVPTRGPNNPYDDFIQTDASINPGSSGGPLFNSRGQVIGINTAIYSPGRASQGGSGFNIGIGFATPSNLVRQISEQLFSKGKVIRGWLGVIIQPVTPDVGNALGLKSPEGALVADVVKGSPASKSSFRRGDVIIRFDDKPVKENSDLPLIVASTPVNKKVDVVVIRKGARKVLKVEIGELTKDALKRSVPEEKELELDRLGMVVQKLTEEMIDSLDLPSADGVIIAQIAPNSLAERAGFQRGDIILEIGDIKIKNPSAYARALKEKAKEKKPVLILVQRKRGTRYLTLTIPAE